MLETEKAESCEWAVFKADRKGILKNCKISSVAKKAQVWRVSPYRVVVYMPKPETVQVVCGESVKAHFVSGLQGIEMKGGCEIVTSAFRIFSPSTLFQDDYVLETAPLVIPQGNFSVGDDQEMMALLEDVKKNVHNPQASYVPPPVHPAVAWSGLSLSGVALGAGVAAIVGVVIHVVMQRRARGGDVN